MASLTQWTWVWASSGNWWWTEKPSILQSMGSQRVGHDWVTELNWTEATLNKIFYVTNKKIHCKGEKRVCANVSHVHSKLFRNLIETNLRYHFLHFLTLLSFSQLWRAHFYCFFLITHLISMSTLMNEKTCFYQVTIEKPEMAVVTFYLHLFTKL